MAASSSVSSSSSSMHLYHAHHAAPQVAAVAVPNTEHVLDAPLLPLFKPRVRLTNRGFSAILGCLVVFGATIFAMQEGSKVDRDHPLGACSNTADSGSCGSHGHCVTGLVSRAVGCLFLSGRQQRCCFTTHSIGCRHLYPPCAFKPAMPVGLSRSRRTN